MNTPTALSALWRRFWPLLPLATSAFLALSSIPPQIDDQFAATRIAGSQSSASPSQFTETLPRPSAYAYESSLAFLPDGRLAALWVGAKTADREETTLWLSIRSGQGWTPPLPVANRESTAGGTFARTGTLGHPSLQIEGSWFEVWYTASVFDDQGEGTLHQTVSTDQGKNWSKPTQLTDSPFKGRLTRLLAQPLPLVDGGVVFPLANRTGPAQARLFFRSATGRSLALRALPSDWPRQHSALVIESKHHLLALGVDETQRWHLAHSEDAGTHWEAPDLLPPPGLISAPLAALRLQDGRLLLAGNHSSQQTLALWLSDDQGKHWTLWETLETAPDGGARFTYPTLRQSRDGRLHLLYSRRGEEIRYVNFAPPNQKGNG